MKTLLKRLAPKITQSIQFAGTPQEFDAAIRRAGTTVITGELALSSILSIAAPHHYRAVPDYVLPSGVRIMSWLRPGIATKRKKNICLATDEIALWGEQHGACVVLSGYHDADETIVQIYTFQRKRLASLDEKRLPARSDKRFGPDFDFLIETIAGQNFGLQIYIAAPLDESLTSRKANLQWLGPEIYSGTTRRLTGANREHLFDFRRHLLAALTTVAGFGAIAFYTVEGLQRFDAARAHFQTEAASVGEGKKYSVRDVRLMEARQHYMDAATKRHELANRSASIAVAVSRAQPDAEVVSITLHLHGGESDKTRLKMIVRMPAGERDATDQIRPVLDAIGSAAAMSVRISSQGWFTQTETPTKKSDKPKVWRHFRIEGV